MRYAVAGALLLAGLALAPTTFAEVEVSGNVAISTDYRFRGISQTDRSPAISGGFDAAWDNGFYVGTWASNVTFSGAAIEMDYYAGFGGQMNENLSYDVGVLWYNYPEDDSDPDLDYFEVYGSLAFGDATVGLAYSPDYFAETDTFFYVYGEYSFSLAENISLDLHVGYNDIKDGEAFGIGEPPSFEDNYIDYSVGVSTSAAGLDLSAAFIGTDLDDDECFGGTKLCEDTVVLTVSKSL